MKRFFCLLTIVTIIFTLSACADNTVKGSIVNKSANGDAELDIMPQKLLEQVGIGDMVVVTIGDFAKEMPFVDELISEDGKLQLFYDRENHNINLCIYNQRFCDVYDVEINEKVQIKKS